MFGLSNPQRFMAFTGPLTPVLWGLAAVLLGVGAWLSFTVPADYQQGDTVRIEETAPISKLKTWKVIERVNAHATPEMIAADA